MLLTRRLFTLQLFLILQVQAMTQVNLPLNEIDNTVKQLITKCIDTYTYFHQNPELSLQEKNTSQRVATELKKAGFNVTRNYGGYGVVAVLKNGKGPTLLIRSDMDALPVEESTGLSYSSTIQSIDHEGKTLPVMHACGHDLHMTVMIGTANAMAKLKKHWKGTLILIAQSGEEISYGAKAMISNGLYKDFPLPDFCLALHASPSIESGKIGIIPGAFFASADMIDLTVHGVGGHGAMPETTIDPIILASQMILALQTIISREIAPTEPALISIGSIHGGTKHNIIPDKVEMQMTIRAYTKDTRLKILESMRRIVNGIAKSAGLPDEKLPHITIRDESTPAVHNDEALTLKVKSAAEFILGQNNVLKAKQVMASEDFAVYGSTQEKIPICLFWLGTVSKEKKDQFEKNNLQLPGLHSPFFAPDPENSITTGIKTMVGSAIYLLTDK